MKKRIVKNYNEYLINTKLFENIIDTDTYSDIKILNTLKKKSNELHVNSILMENVVDDSLFESVEDVALKIYTNEWEKDPVLFYESYRKSLKSEYLSTYPIEEIKEFDLYKIKGYDIGFAIKKDGDIILVHNNSKVKGIGNALIKKSIEKGGKKLDHFDGFLTGFYRKNGFGFESNSFFNKEYAPDNWNYQKIDITNPNVSIYAEELIVDSDMFEIATVRYENGKPDVVYRKTN